MNDYIIDIAIACVVGITGVYCSYVISPYISKGLEVVSEKVITLPLPEEKETTKFVFICLSGLFMMHLADILLVSKYVIAELAPVMWPAMWHQIDPQLLWIQEVSAQTLANDQQLLKNLAICTNFHSNEDHVGTLSLTLIQKIMSSGIFISNDFLDSINYLWNNVANREYLANISNEELMQAAPVLREYFLSQYLQLPEVDYQALMQTCNAINDDSMKLFLLESLNRWGPSAGGVNSNEIILRHDYIRELMTDNQNMDLFNSFVIRANGKIIVVHDIPGKWFIDGCSYDYNYNWKNNFFNYNVAQIQGINIHTTVGALLEINDLDIIENN